MFEEAQFHPNFSEHWDIYRDQLFADAKHFLSIFLSPFPI